jgi:hypothetical protein
LFKSNALNQAMINFGVIKIYVLGARGPNPCMLVYALGLFACLYTVTLNIYEGSLCKLVEA